MTNVTGGTRRRPFSSLGDQQLLEQTRRLAANQRGLEVHILDHLDEIDRRGLALRRGFSSLFDYAVRELRFTDAAAQRRIQTMRLCRRHGWVRTKLQSGELSVTSAAQFETAFGAAERQCRRASAQVGQERCDDLHGLPAAPSVAGDLDAEAPQAGAGMAGAAAMTASAPPGVAAVDPEARSLGDAGGREDRHPGSDRCRPSPDDSAAADARPAAAGAQPVGRLDSSAATSGAAPDSNTATLHASSHASPDAAPGRAPRARLTGHEAATTPVVPVASHAAAQLRGVRHADAPPARRESSGAASNSPAPVRAPGPAVGSSHHGPAAPLLPPASGAAPVPLPVVAAAEPRLTAALAPAPSRGDRNPKPGSSPELCASPERSAGPVSAAALLHPRRQRELIEQAAGMTTRQVAGLLARAAPQLVPPRDTLRAVAPDRFTLKVSIDQECEQGLRQLKDLRSHVDPRMSWGDLVARLVREAVARHDPRSGGRGRGRTGGRAASSRRERTGTPPVVAAGERAGCGGGDTPAPQGEPAAAGEQPRAATSPNAAPVRGVAPAAPAPAAPAPAAPAPAAPAPAAPSPATAAAGAKALGARADAAASATAAVAAAPEGQSARARVRCPAPRRPASAAPRLTRPAAPAGAACQARPSGAPEAAAAPQFSGSCPADGAEAAPVPPAATPAPQSISSGTAHGADATPVPPATTPAPQLATGVPPARGAGAIPEGTSPPCTRDTPLPPRRPPPRRPIPAAVRRYVWLRDGGRCCYWDPLTGRRCNSAHLLQIHHLLPVVEGGGPEPDNLALACLAHHRLWHGYGPTPPSVPSR